MKKKLKVLVTAGPTREPIDPVRFISNRSTGVMGYEIAGAAAKKRHRVTLISGPTCLRPPKGVRLVPVTTVEELKKATLSRMRDADCLFMVAAVSDWRVSRLSKEKIKRSRRKLRLLLEPTADILELVGRSKGKRVVVGFSLETRSGIAEAKRKLKRKNLDIIVANNLSRKQSPFGNKKIKSVIVDKAGKVERLPPLSKSRIANLLLDRVEMAQWPRS